MDYGRLSSGLKRADSATEVKKKQISPWGFKEGVYSKSYSRHSGFPWPKPYLNNFGKSPLW